MKTLILVILLSLASVANAQHYVTFGWDAPFNGAPGMSMGRVQQNSKRGIIGLQRALAGTPYAFTPAGSYHPTVRLCIKDLRATPYRNDYGYCEMRTHKVFINSYPVSPSTGKTYVWTDDIMASVAAHECLHAIAPNLSHAQMAPYEKKGHELAPKVGEKMADWPLR